MRAPACSLQYRAFWTLKVPLGETGPEHGDKRRSGQRRAAAYRDGPIRGLTLSSLSRIDAAIDGSRAHLASRAVAA